MPFLFALTLFVSATLLFLLQPMVGKMILPYLGGSPAVWNTCLVFFQAALLAGYLYAHGLTRRLSSRQQAVCHAALLLLPLLPLALLQLDVDWIARRWISPPGEANPIPWLLAVLVLTAGLPFFVVSTSAPLLQKWFAATTHWSAQDPYYLYAASNLGSMLALLGYPTLVEPNLSLPTQTGLWIAGYGLLLALIACCAATIWRSASTNAITPTGISPRHPATPSPRHSVPLLRRLRWLALAFVPSSLMLGVTTYITTDLAAIPLLWVIPLAIYLLSFILVFSRMPVLVHRLVVLLLPALILLVVFRIPEGVQGYLSVGDVVLFDFIILRRLTDLIVLHLVGLFVASMVCHGELARTRPGPQHLTEFYLWMSLGGVLGGLFNGLVAPLLFDRIVEYPLMIVGACLLLPRLAQKSDAGWFRGLDRVLSVAFGLFGFAIGGFLLARTYVTVQTVPRLPRPLQEPADWFVENYGRDDSWVLLRERSFFGVTMISAETRADGSLMHWMYHGTTVHGGQQFSTEESRTSRGMMPIAAGNPLEAAILLEAQQVDPQREPLTYFHRQGPIGRLFRAMKEKQPRQRVAVLGMGAGTLAAYAEPGWQITFFEIDPAVVRIAENPAYFTYLHDCRKRIGNDNVNIVLGDGRLKLQESHDTYDLLFMDAFSSDSVPVHMITREAIDMYFEKLAPGGILVVNIASRYLNLKPVLANLAQATGRQAIVAHDAPDSAIGKYASLWVLMAREGKDFGALGRDLVRWPWDPDRHWHNLLAPPSAEALTARDLADWKRDFIARKRFELQLDEEAVESFRRDFDATPASEVKQWIQWQNDTVWQESWRHRQRVGVWTDRFSNLLSVLY